jgi:hypothetical protein
MKFIDGKLKLKGTADKFKGNEIEVKVSVPQYEKYEEALPGVGGEIGVLDIINDFVANRAKGSLRSKFANFLKTATDWASCQAYAEEQKSTVKDYTYTADRGPSRKKQHDILDNIDKAKLQEMSKEELLAKLAELTGAAI